MWGDIMELFLNNTVHGMTETVSIYTSTILSTFVYFGKKQTCMKNMFMDRIFRLLKCHDIFKDARLFMHNVITT